MSFLHAHLDKAQCAATALDFDASACSIIPTITEAEAVQPLPPTTSASQFGTKYRFGHLMNLTIYNRMVDKTPEKHIKSHSIN